MTKRLLAATALLSAAFFGGAANAGCVAPDVCYGGGVLVYEGCVPQPKGACTPTTVEVPLCFGGPTWTAGLCWL